MPKRPGFVFYPDDWMGDIGLRQCCAASRGIWIDLLSLMHQGEPYGHLSSKTGEIAVAFVARSCGVTVSELADAILELEKHGVFSRAESGILFSRKMVRDEDIRLRRANGGKKSVTNPNVPKAKEPTDPERIPIKDIHAVPSLTIGNVPTNTNTKTLDSNQETIPSDRAGFDFSGWFGARWARHRKTHRDEPRDLVAGILIEDFMSGKFDPADFERRHDPYCDAWEGSWQFNTESLLVWYRNGMLPASRASPNQQRQLTATELRMRDA
jgi:hypothetical protein